MKLENFNFSKKIFYHTDKIQSLKSGGRPFPVTMEIDLTNNCNHRCSFCFYADKIGRGKMPTLDKNILKKTIEDLKKLDTRGISFTGGGEPMLHPDFYEIIKFTKNQGLDVGLITNGSAIVESKMINLLENLTWIRISMAGGDSNSYQKVQGVDQFEKVIINISNLSKAKNNLKLNTNIGIRILITKDNLISLETLPKHLNYKLVNYIQLAPDQFTNDNGQFWNSESTQKIFKDFENNMKNLSINVLTTNYVWSQKNLSIPRKCYAHYFQTAITAEGDLIFCKNARGENKFIIGNIYKDKLINIWNSKNNKSIEEWVKPSNCGLYCKHIDINLAVEENFYPDFDMSKNFVG